MVGPARRRRAVAMLRDRFGVSERWACRVVGQPRSTQRHAPSGRDERRCAAELREFSVDDRGGDGGARPSAAGGGLGGEPQAGAAAVARGGAAGPAAQAQAPALGVDRHGGAAGAEPPERVGVRFQFDQTADGRALKLLNVVDEFTRESLAMLVERSIDADTAWACWSGSPPSAARRSTLRCDNGPEMTAHALRDWCERSKTGTAFIEPGSPWQNPFVESFHSRVRDELLDVEEFSCLAEARVVIGQTGKRTTTSAARTPRSG